MSIPKLKIYLLHKVKLQIYKYIDANVHRKLLAQKHLKVILRSSTILLTNVKILTCPKPDLYELTILESVYVSLWEDRKTCFASVPGFSLDIAIHSETCIHTLPNGNSEVIGSARQKNPRAFETMDTVIANITLSFQVFLISSCTLAGSGYLPT